jgi:hypothetical protein
MLERRAFLISCGWLVTGSFLAEDDAAGTSLVVSLLPGMKTDETPAVVLHIEGWDKSLSCDEGASNRIWIGVNRSWRSAWR